MKVIAGKNIVCMTSEKEATTAVKDFVGMKLPAAFLLNHGVHGYGKFVYDEQTLRSFQTNLHKISDKLDRKQAYNVMYDMIKGGRIAGARVLDIINKNIGNETAEDILQDNFKSLIPTIIGKYIPMDQYVKTNQDLFESTLKILASGQFTVPSTQELLLNSIISFANGDKQLNIIYEWFMKDKITDLKGKVI